MDVHKQSTLVKTKVAKHYFENFINLPIYNETYDFVCKELNVTKAIVLEIGCGTGICTRYLLSKRPDFRILATDVKPSVIKLAKETVSKAHFALFNYRELYKIYIKVNAVVFNYCLPYLQQHDVEKLIFNASNLLIKDGLIYLTFIEGEYEDSCFQVAENSGEENFCLYSSSFIEKLLLDNNLNIIKTFRVAFDEFNFPNQIHTTIIAKKI